MLNDCEKCKRSSWCIVELYSKHCILEKIEITELPRSRDDRRHHARSDKDRRD